MNASGLPQLRIIVLAAGYSRRLGTPKALARVHGASLLRRTALVLAPLVQSELIVIAPPRAWRLRVELRRIRAVVCGNSRRFEGLASSVRLGLLRAKFSAGVLIVPVDLAALERRDLRRLIAAASSKGEIGLRDIIARLAPEQCVLIDLPSAAFDVDTAEDLTRARRNWAATAAGAWP
jgi:CTP:molybdopterin cytidylyltransferase MocA